MMAWEKCMIFTIICVFLILLVFVCFVFLHFFFILQFFYIFFPRLQWAIECYSYIFFLTFVNKTEYLLIVVWSVCHINYWGHATELSKQQQIGSSDCDSCRFAHSCYRHRVILHLHHYLNLICYISQIAIPLEYCIKVRNTIYCCGKTLRANPRDAEILIFTPTTISNICFVPEYLLQFILLQ